jgi:periplasmic divalent cation tolerance protein
MTPVIVLTTVGTTFDPLPLATQLVEKRLAACVNVIPAIQSVYRWQGKIENDSEKLLLIKTVDTRLAELKTTLFASHPYEVPEFVVLQPEELSDAYKAWLLSNV